MAAAGWSRTTVRALTRLARLRGELLAVPDARRRPTARPTGRASSADRCAGLEVMSGGRGSCTCPSRRRLSPSRSRTPARARPLKTTVIPYVKRPAHAARTARRGGAGASGRVASSPRRYVGPGASLMMTVDCGAEFSGSFKKPRCRTGVRWTRSRWCCVLGCSGTR